MWFRWFFFFFLFYTAVSLSLCYLFFPVLRSPHGAPSPLYSFASRITFDMIRRDKIAFTVLFFLIKDEVKCCCCGLNCVLPSANSLSLSRLTAPLQLLLASQLQGAHNAEEGRGTTYNFTCAAVRRAVKKKKKKRRNERPHERTAFTRFRSRLSSSAAAFCRYEKTLSLGTTEFTAHMFNLQTYR